MAEVGIVVRLIFLAVLGLWLAKPARGAESDIYCLTGTSSTGAPAWAPASSGKPCPVTATTNVTPTTYAGTINLAAATSTSLTSGNVTMQLGSLPAAGSFTKLTIIAPGPCLFTLNLNGSAITAATQGIQIGTGTNVGADTLNLTGLANAPTLWSSAGCTAIQFNN